MNKGHIYQDNIRRSLRETWSHLEKLVLTLPEGEHLEWDELSKEHQHTVNNIKAVEAEWIVDPSIRNELSLLQEEEDS